MITDKKQILALDTETSATDPVSPHHARFFCYSTYNGTVGKCIMDSPLGLEDFSKYYILAQNGKYDKIVLNKQGVKVNIDWDTQVAEYLLNIDKGRKLEDVYERYTGISKKDIFDVYNNETGKNRKTLPEEWYKDISHEALSLYAIQDVEATYKIYEKQKEIFKKNPKLFKWFLEIEMPLVNIISEMELKGVKVNVNKLKRLGAEWAIENIATEKDLKFLADNNELNLNSPKQIQEVLYKKFKLPVLKKTKTKAPSTDVQVLTKLAERHAFPKLLLNYRLRNKLISTYVDPIVDKLDKNNRLHTNYNQCLTKTRRFSSDSPNLQNIPVRSELGRSVKECFIPEAGHKFLIADYDQVELRILAHLSQDNTMIEAFKNGDDVHQQTADLMSKKLKKSIDRSMGKTLNFSIVYGKTAYGFSQDWGCSQQEAQEIIDGYFQARQGVSDYIKYIQDKAIRTGGWLETIAGLHLFVGDTRSNNKVEFEHAMRCAVDYPIQGSSQDILKKAVVDTHDVFKCFPVLMVHDELVYEIPTSASNPEGIVNRMETAWELCVPLKVSYKISDRWEK